MSFSEELAALRQAHASLKDLLRAVSKDDSGNSVLYKEAAGKLDAAMQAAQAVDQLSAPNGHQVTWDVEWLLAAASAHAEFSDAGLAAELSDLNGILAQAWQIMRPDQRHSFMMSEDVKSTVEDACGEWRPPTYGTQDTSKQALRWLLTVARDHGEDEPDHQAGDLQEFIRAAWEHLDNSQQRQIVHGESVGAALEMLDIELAESLDDVTSKEWFDGTAEVGPQPNDAALISAVVDFVNARRLASEFDDSKRHTIEPRKRDDAPRG